MTASTRFRPELLAPLLCDLAAQGKLGEIPIHGTSMCPTLLDGDRVWVIPAKPEEVRVGDLVVRMEDARPIIHRFVGWWWTRDGWRMLTKGDSIHWFDSPLRPDGVVGRVVARERENRVRPMDGIGMRLRGRARAAASLLGGLIGEAWNRGRRAVRQWIGWPGG